MTQIVGFAGKKQSGKNTACNYILALKLAELGVCARKAGSQKKELSKSAIYLVRLWRTKSGSSFLIKI